MQRFKKTLAMLLAMVMVIGAINLPQTAKTVQAAAQQATLSLSEGHCQTGVDQRWLIYLNISGATITGDIYWNNNTVYVDGKACSGSGVNYAVDMSGNRLMLCLKFDHAPNDGVTHTLLIPKGTVIGDIEVLNDFALVLGSDKNVYTATPVQLNYSGGGAQDGSLGSRYALNFATSGVTELTNNYWAGSTGYAQFDNTVYVNDSKVSGSGVNFGVGETTLSLYLQYGKIKADVTTCNSLDPFTLSIPRGTILGNTPAKYLVVTKTIKLDINKGTIALAVEPDATVTLSNDASRNQIGNARNGFYFFTSEDDGLTADSSWATRYSFTTGGIYYNDSVVSGAKLVKILPTLYYVAFDGCGITFAAGDTVKIDGTVNSGGRVVKYVAQTFEYDGNGNWDIYVPKSEVTLTLGTGSGAQDNQERFLVYLTGLDAEQMTAMDGKSATLTIDGVEKTGASSYVKLNETTFVLLLKYTDLEADKTVASEMSPHTVQIKAGTEIGGWVVADDVTFHTMGNDVESGPYVSNGVTLTFGANSGAQDDQKRFLIYLTGVDTDQINAIGGKPATLTIDGVEKTGDSAYHKLSDTQLVLVLMYSDLESNVTKATELKPHTVEIPAGTMLGDYTVTETVSISIDSDTIVDTASLTEVELSLASEPESGPQDNETRYCLYFDGLTKEQIMALNGKSVPLYVDDVKVSGHSKMYFYQMANYDTTILYLLPYEILEKDVTEVAKLSPHVVEFKKGTIFNGSYVLGKDLVLKVNQHDIAEYVKPYLVNPEVVDAVTASVDGTVLTVNGTGTVKASDLADVTAATITEIRIEGPCSIESQAFVGYTALTKVWFSNTVLNAASNAFSGCASGVKAIYVKGRTLTGGLAEVENHEYYSFKILTLGSSYGEDTNNYVYTLAKDYYSNLPGRTSEDIAYDDIVVAELFSGGCPLSDRVKGIMGNPATTCYYEKWDENGAVIPTTPTGQLTGDLMKMALQDEYWDVVILMQSAEDSRRAASFLVSTAGNGVADIDTMINFAKANNKNHSGSKYLWLQTWSYNEKLNTLDYEKAIAAEETMRIGIVDSMQTVVQDRIDLGGLDGILPVGASIEYLKKSYLNAEDPNYTSDKTSGTYNNGVYSTYFALQRDTAHASIGLGRFTLGLTAFGFLAELENAEIQALASKCYPKNYEECEVSEKLEGEQTVTKAYMKYDEYTKDCAPQAYSAAIKAIADPYNVTKIYKTGDATGDDKVDALDLIRYKKAQAGTGEIMDVATADINMDGVVDAADLAVLRNMFVWNKLQ